MKKKHEIRKNVKLQLLKEEKKEKRKKKNSSLVPNCNTEIQKGEIFRKILGT